MRSRILLPKVILPPCSNVLHPELLSPVAVDAPVCSPHPVAYTRYPLPFFLADRISTARQGLRLFMSRHFMHRDKYAPYAQQAREIHKSEVELYHFLFCILILIYIFNLNLHIMWRHV